jgi:c-di-GMP-binding flagellar brake protein YcgR
MLTLEQNRSLFAYELDPTEALRVLEVAIRRRVEVSLTPKTRAEASLDGSIRSATSESLWIVFDDPDAESCPGLQSMCCEVAFELDGARYQFETNVLAVVADGNDRQVEVARPGGLQVLQRRRFWRAQVHESSPVRIASAHTDEDSVWSGTAAMMNVSPAGLACLAQRYDADAAAIGDVLQVTFELPGDGEPFTLQGVVRSKTPAGTDDRIVLGLEFRLGQDRDSLHRLQAILQHYA